MTRQGEMKLVGNIGGNYSASIAHWPLMGSEIIHNLLIRNMLIVGNELRGRFNESSLKAMTVNRLKARKVLDYQNRLYISTFNVTMLIRIEIYSRDAWRP